MKSILPRFPAMKVKKYRNSPKQAALKQGADLMLRIEQKGMPFDHDFGYSFPFSLPS